MLVLARAVAGPGYFCSRSAKTCIRATPDALRGRLPSQVRTKKQTRNRTPPDLLRNSSRPVTEAARTCNGATEIALPRVKPLTFVHFCGISSSRTPQIPHFGLILRDFRDKRPEPRHPPPQHFPQFLLSLWRTTVCAPRAGEALKGKPVEIRNCARSCELRNGPATMPLKPRGFEKAPRREQSEDLPCQV